MSATLSHSPSVPEYQATPVDEWEKQTGLPERNISLLIEVEDRPVASPRSGAGGSSILMQRKQSQVVLTAQDLNENSEDDVQEQFNRSQDLLADILRTRGIKTSTRAKFYLGERHDVNDIEWRRADFTDRVFSRLRRRGIHGIRAFRVMLHNTDMESDGTCLGRTLEGSLAHMGIRLRENEYDDLLLLFGAQDAGQDAVDYVKLLAYGCSNWSTQRQEVVKEAYDYLSVVCPGSMLTAAALEAKFKPEALTQDLIPELVEHGSAEEFFTQWSRSPLGADGIVKWLDFVDYYFDVSLSMSSDKDFCHYVCKSWGIDMDDWLAKKIFRNYTTTSENHDTLPAADFIRMLNDLDPNISEEEAVTWYETIDEDDSGEVSLEEFLSSKVLKVKRLFDLHDKDHSGTIDQTEMIAILQGIHPEITPQEATLLYRYADLDGNGEISFCEFLENDLLKLLHIFDEFDRTKTRAFNEAEMKNLLRKLDPFLDDYDIQQIYKAIDVDGSGSIDFAEFCESHVLRAKTLFDRYDIDRSRTLTQFKFRELMLDMDDTLSTSQMEAIYNLVADQNSGKVQLGGFLNPNIVKIKMLFDKHDQDRSRYLDSYEFKSMLKDMFKSATDKEIHVLHATVCPEGADQGMTFISYIQRFKEISRKYDLMQLAKRREARLKAKSKGMVYMS